MRYLYFYSEEEPAGKITRFNKLTMKETLSTGKAFIILSFIGTAPISNNYSRRKTFFWT
jgi:hypothetical protein